MSIRVIMGMAVGVVVAGSVGCGGIEDAASPAETLAASRYDSDEEFSKYLDSLCHSFPGGSVGPSVSYGDTCAGCDSAALEQATDGQDATFANVSFDALDTGPVDFRVESVDGSIFAAGQSPAVTLSAPRHENNYRVEVRTYLGGELQERACQTGVSFNSRDRLVFGLDATVPFDAFELELIRNNVEVAQVDCGVGALNISNAQDLAEGAELRVHEFCEHFEIPGQ